MQIIILGYCGNETIDRYPLGKGGIKKILVVSERIFEKLQKDFELFFQGLSRGRTSRRSSLLGAPRGQILRPQQPLQASGPKIDPGGLVRRFRDYEPTAAIYLNECDYRRWCRVSEWFNQYAQGAAENILKRSFTQIKMDT